jgi:hypothetical protein
VSESRKVRGLVFTIYITKGFMADQKEIVFSGLRLYHTQQFPQKFSNNELDQIKLEFELFAEQVTNGILSFVSGKAEFVDSSTTLNVYRQRIIDLTLNEDESRTLFISKIDQLTSVVKYAKGCSFKLRRPAVIKA